ncbi:MAG: TIGR01777 family oxidoreductase [Acidobacteriota bacterium]|nr:TIGR01777 family oxidoreductase [Acidobacteriota bacterium]MDQ7088223.1 TIGR01777 family oxidoreductase [Acidobacteriota bacterium]
MRVLVTGAGGFIGRALVARLVEEGRQVVALSRRPRAVTEALPELSGAWAWQPQAGPPPAEALEGVGAVVHLAGEPVAGIWTRAKRRAIEDSRVSGTRHLVEGLVAGGTGGVLVSASAIGFYGERGDAILDEGEGPTDDFLSRVCRQWEQEARQAEAAGWRVVRLRIGIVLERGGGALGAMERPFRLGMGGRLGRGRQWWSWIHREDLVEMILWALGGQVGGAVNATAPGPVRQGEFARELGRALHRPAWLPAPAFALRILTGGFAWELLSSKRVLPRRALEAGFRFRHPELPAALGAIYGEAR